MINNVLTTDGFYFCTDYDLTHTLQRLANTSPDFQEMSLLERVRYAVNCLAHYSHVFTNFSCRAGILNLFYFKAHLIILATGQGH